MVRDDRLTSAIALVCARITPLPTPDFLQLVHTPVTAPSLGLSTFQTVGLAILHSQRFCIRYVVHHRQPPHRI
ncbi:hypothetical protein LC653_39500 [Nostoc sp. CHAB 5784]|uniref:hypothetical protein n=1 Tax=Nostoc mirabile TaxID=2907820 RepID=UPI001E5DFD98|nr:hypothetical protein [Nostoc mirabile]MCC5669735.1 hypothetical protein [Nostoc mirabile CHAB5784]